MTHELMENGKGGDRDLISGTIPAFVWMDWGKP
jgi:hypothetical protein